jgi:hypothetical protein
MCGLWKTGHVVPHEWCSLPPYSPALYQSVGFCKCQISMARCIIHPSFVKIQLVLSEISHYHMWLTYKRTKERRQMHSYLPNFIVGVNHWITYSIWSHQNTRLLVPSGLYAYIDLDRGFELLWLKNKPKYIFLKATVNLSSPHEWCSTPFGPIRVIV